MVDHNYISVSMVVRKWQLAEKEPAFLLMGVEKTMYPVLVGVEASLVDNPVLRVVESCLENLLFQGIDHCVMRVQRLSISLLGGQPVMEYVLFRLL